MEANDAEEPQLSVRNRRRSRRAQREQKRKRKRKQRSNYNSEFGESAEFASLCWDDWSKYPRLTLGSQDSLDLDVVYIFPKRPSVTQCYNFCDPPVDKSTGRWKEPEENPPSEKEENRNIIILDQDGVVCDCFKGIPDAIHNCIFYTYSLHTQSQPNPCTALVHRNVVLRVVKGVRDLVGLLCKTDRFRVTAKQAIKSNNFLVRRQLLSEVDYEDIKADPVMGIPTLKIIAFHYAQMIALMEGQELYTKSLLSERFPELRCFLYRSEEALSKIHILNKYRDACLEMLQDVAVSQRKDIAIFSADVDTLSKRQAWNMFSYQSRGMAIDIRKEYCVSYPLDNYHALHKDRLPSWPTDEELIDREELTLAIHTDSEDEVSFYTCFHNLGGELVVIAEDGFDIPSHVEKLIGESLHELLSKIDHSLYSLILAIKPPKDEQEGAPRLVLYAVRDRHTWSLLPHEAVVRLAGKWNPPSSGDVLLPLWKD